MIFMTKQQAITVHYNQELHYTGKQNCARIIGPRGSETIQLVKVRVSGKCQTWKTRPDEFRLPVKHGLCENGAVTHLNGKDFHLTDECPLNESEGCF